MVTATLALARNLLVLCTAAALTQSATASFDVAVSVGSAHATTVITSLTSVTMDVRHAVLPAMNCFENCY